MPSMRKSRMASAPTRIDFAGGTLDIWPVNMLVERALTINVSIDLLATTRVEEIDEPASGRPRAEIRSEDIDLSEIWEDAKAPPRDTRLPLIAECVRYLDPDRSFRLTTTCASPAGAGLGGSSSLAISLLGALESFLDRTIIPPEESIAVARDIEARVLKIPTGTQDHFAAIYGGASAIHHGPGRPVREALAVDLERLAARLVLVYCGASRLSARANWDMVRRALDAEQATCDSMAAIAGIAHEMRTAFLADDFEAIGALMSREQAERRRLSPEVSTPLIERTIESALAAGAAAGKICGAGGGGCIALLCPEEARGPVLEAVKALSSEGVRILEARPVAVGLQLGS